MSKLKAGIIGAGQIAETVHIANYQKYPEEVEVTAIVDTIPEKARAIAEKYNIPYYFSSAKEILRLSSVSMVLGWLPACQNRQYVAASFLHQASRC